EGGGLVIGYRPLSLGRALGTEVAVDAYARGDFAGDAALDARGHGLVDIPRVAGHGRDIGPDRERGGAAAGLELPAAVGVPSDPVAAAGEVVGEDVEGAPADVADLVVRGQERVRIRRARRGDGEGGRHLAGEDPERVVAVFEVDADAQGVLVNGAAPGAG